MEEATTEQVNYHFSPICESDYEASFISFLEEVGWKYTSGSTIFREKKTDVLIASDFKDFVARANPNLTPEETEQMFDAVRLAVPTKDNTKTADQMWFYTLIAFRFA